MSKVAKVKVRKGRFAYILAIVFVTTFTYWTAVSHSGSPQPVHANPITVPVYSPQPERTAEWDGPRKGQGAQATDYSADQIQKLAQNASYEVLNTSGTVQSRFADASKIVAAGKQYNNNIGVFEYFNASFMYTVNLNTNWQPYVSSFNTGWYLHDSTGQAITYKYGKSNVLGYLLDLSNPAYRSWAVNTIVSWMKAAPFKGIALDSADQWMGKSYWRGFGAGTQDMNDLLCGTGAPVDANGNCSRVAAWDNGLATFEAQVSAALHPLGDEVIFNGIAPSPLRVPVRNLNMAQNADTAANESFCYDVTPSLPDKLNFEPFSDDINIEKSLAAQGKRVLEITNHLNSAVKQPYANYCFGGFMMGWQPGSTYYTYHANYSDLLPGAYPEDPDQNLNLGLPVSSGYSTSGNVMYRNFQNGIVAVNTADTPANFTLPTAVTEFNNGLQANSYIAGSSVQLAARSARFFLNDAYLYPRASASGGNSSSSPSPTAGGTVATSPKSTDPGTSNSANNSSSSMGNDTRVSQPLSGDLSGKLQLSTSNLNGQLVKVEYYVDGKLVRKVTKFPDNTQLDTKTFTNGNHKLLIKYYYSNGKIKSATKTITVYNQLSVTAQAAQIVKPAIVPSATIVLLLIVVVFAARHAFAVTPRWLYHRVAYSKAVIVQGQFDDSPHPPHKNAYEPGAVIRPDHHH